MVFSVKSQNRGLQGKILFLFFTKVWQDWLLLLIINFYLPLAFRHCNWRSFKHEHPHIIAKGLSTEWAIEEVSGLTLRTERIWCLWKQNKFIVEKLKNPQKCKEDCKNYPWFSWLEVPILNNLVDKVPILFSRLCMNLCGCVKVFCLSFF